MRVTWLDIPKEAAIENGLEPVRMRQLGQVVVLAGPNGSGKTRLMAKLREVCRLVSSRPKKDLPQLHEQLDQ